MRKETKLNQGNYRLLKAAAITLALVVAAPGADVVVRFVASPQTASAVYEEGAFIDSSRLLDAGDVFASLDRIEGVAKAGEANLPEAFSREVGLLPNARDVRVGSGGSVVGYLVDDECESVLARLDDHMESRGWTSVSLGGAAGATYVKKSGSCRWALATCIQEASGTSVVVRCVVE